jgi:hypothetical protein
MTIPNLQARRSLALANVEGDISGDCINMMIFQSVGRPRFGLFSFQFYPPASDLLRSYPAEQMTAWRVDRMAGVSNTNRKGVAPLG